MKKIKYFLLIAMSIILIFVGGVCFYIFVGENEDTKTTKAEMEQITSDVMTQIDAAMAEDTDQTSGEENQQQQGGESEALPQEQEKTENPNGIANKQSKDISKKEEKLLGIYDTAFYDLQASANAIVDGLVVAIKGDYDILKSRNEASPDRMMKLGASYTKRANALEGQVDSSVNVVLHKMETDMQAQGIDSKRIAGYRKAYEEEYSRQKEARRNAIMGKAQEMM